MFVADAIASDESIRITPSLRSKKGERLHLSLWAEFIYLLIFRQYINTIKFSYPGQVWSKMKNSNENWEVEVTFRISGRGRVGADGLVCFHICSAVLLMDFCRRCGILWTRGWRDPCLAPVINGTGWGCFLTHSTTMVR